MITLSKEELSQIKETVKSIESQLSNLKNKIVAFEKSMGATPAASAELLSIPPPKVESRPAAAEVSTGKPLAAPIPSLGGGSEPKASVISSNTQMTAAASSTGPRKRITKQVLPKGGAVSQVKARQGKHHCPQCDSNYYEELEDKKRVLYVMGPGLNVYGKKLRCWNCGNEWPKPAD